MRLHVFFHIEKVAGTSVLSALEDIYGRKCVYQHQPRVQKFIASDKLITSRTDPFWDSLYKKVQQTPLIKPIYKIYDRGLTHGLFTRGKWLNFNEIPGSALAIHGHFYPSQVAGIKRKMFKSTVIRDPLKRMYSQYEHWKRIKGFAAWRFNVDFNPKITFEEYALLPQLTNFQSKALEYKDLSFFDLVGTTEHLDTFISNLEKEFDTIGKVRKENHLNSKTSEKKMKFDKKFENIFKKANRDDYELYKKALKLSSKKR